MLKHCIAWSPKQKVWHRTRVSACRVEFIRVARRKLFRAFYHLPPSEPLSALLLDYIYSKPHLPSSSSCPPVQRGRRDVPDLLPIILAHSLSTSANEALQLVTTCHGGATIMKLISSTAEPC